MRTILVAAAFVAAVFFLTTPVGAWHFTDVTAAAGINHVQGMASAGSRPLVPQFTAGVAAGDFDRDGWPDLFVTLGSAGPNRLYKNRGDGTFEDVAAAAGVADGLGRYHDPAFVDLDGDGWLDLWVGGLKTGIRLYKNRGDGTFEDLSAGSGLPTFTFTSGPAFGDADADADLDVFVPQWNDGPAELLWMNGGDFTFTSASATAFDLAAREALLYTFTPNFTDLDNDGHLDLVVASDFGWSQVLLARGDGTFRLATDETVIVDENGMGASIGDFDGDGHLDWFVGSIYGTTKTYGNRLYGGRGDGTFEDRTDAGFVDGGWAWGSCAGDFDNDGRLDLFQTNGWDRLSFGDDLPRLFMARANGLVDEAVARGLVDVRMGRGVVCFDYDRDGDLDLYVAHHGAGPVLWRNDGGHATGAHLAVRLDGFTPNTAGIGARLELVLPSGAVLVREMRAGSNYASQNPAVAHFGLGAVFSPQGTSELTVHWPVGRRSRLLEISPGTEIVVSEGLIARDGFESGDLTGWIVP